MNPKLSRPNVVPKVGIVFQTSERTVKFREYRWGDLDMTTISRQCLELGEVGNNMNRHFLHFQRRELLAMCIRHYK